MRREINVHRIFLFLSRKKCFYNYSFILATHSRPAEIPKILGLLSNVEKMKFQFPSFEWADQPSSFYLANAALLPHPPFHSTPVLPPNGPVVQIPGVVQAASYTCDTIVPRDPLPEGSTGYDILGYCLRLQIGTSGSVSHFFPEKRKLSVISEYEYRQSVEGRKAPRVRGVHGMLANLRKLAELFQVPERREGAAAHYIMWLRAEDWSERCKYPLADGWTKTRAAEQSDVTLLILVPSLLIPIILFTLTVTAICISSLVNLLRWLTVNSSNCNFPRINSCFQTKTFKRKMII
ncbi:unnamed protein product [Nesidiocoris tenuis]|uniref:Uncharacterized protein n=1 Tax=Nesidiocoris tenuis TaxID=355587 RepID=A0A6H5GAU8_9HEMI|nr:unnamed protein product [Nesidiocoris tenuis]